MATPFQGVLMDGVQPDGIPGDQGVSGLDLAMEFYTLCRPILLREIPDVMERAAVGLAGEASECFGMDNSFARNHDYGPGFCMWLPDEMLAREKDRIEAAFDALPVEFAGYPSRVQRSARQDGTGPRGIREFYRYFTGLDRAPQGWKEWLRLGEWQLAAATNGEIFEDATGEFTTWRQKLLDFYPQDVWLKKLASRLMVMAQSGQYNLPRSLRRNEIIAAMLAQSRFVEAAISFVFLLNREYMPYYKWAPAKCRELPVLGGEVWELCHTLATYPLRGQQDMAAAEIIEDFCVSCAAHLRALDLSEDADSWLWAQGAQLNSLIADEELRRLHEMHNTNAWSQKNIINL